MSRHSFSHLGMEDPFVIDAPIGVCTEISPCTCLTSPARMRSGDCPDCNPCAQTHHANFIGRVVMVWSMSSRGLPVDPRNALAYKPDAWPACLGTMP